MTATINPIDRALAKLADSAGPRTKVREKRQAYYRKYYETHPEQTLKDQERQREYQDESRETAERHGEAWDANDLLVALKLQQPLMVSAQDAQRTYAAIRQGRYRLIRKSGFRNTLLKGEEQEFDALVRNEDATAEDWIALDEKWRGVFAKTLPNSPTRDGFPWVDWEIEMLRDRTLSDERMAAKLGRTPYAVKSARERQRGGQMKPSTRWWTEDQIAILADVSLSHSEAAKATGRTRAAVRQKRAQMRGGA